VVAATRPRTITQEHLIGQSCCLVAGSNPRRRFAICTRVAVSFDRQLDTNTRFSSRTSLVSAMCMLNYCREWDKRTYPTSDSSLTHLFHCRTSRRSWLLFMHDCTRVQLRHAWLPHEVTSASTLPVFCSRLKTYPFQLSFPTN